jgi:hypothetical protein
MSPHNYPPTALRKVAPTEDNGKGLPDTEKIDLLTASVSSCHQTQAFQDLVGTYRRKKGNSHYVDELEAVYGAAPHGIERYDFLVRIRMDSRIFSQGTILSLPRRSLPAAQSAFKSYGRKKEAEDAWMVDSLFFFFTSAQTD